jgi:hypothetical protein
LKNKNIQELSILTNNLRHTLRPSLSWILSKYVVFLVILLGATIKVKAQTISMDQLPIEDALRRLQLMGKIESDISFMSRPLQPTKIGAWDSALKWLDPVYFKKGLHPIGKKFLGNTFYATVLPLQVVSQYVTEQPFQELDGPMIASSGQQTFISGGVYLKLGPLTIQYQPQLVWADNKNYRGTIQTPNYHYPDSYSYDHYKNNLVFNGVFDNAFLKNNLLGNSSIRLNAGPVSVGVSSENLTWGPSIMNPLLMSSHAPGFMHISFNSRRPWRTKIGSFEWQWVAAYLEEINPAYRGVAENYMGYGKDQSHDEKRYFNGAMLTYQPKWIKGLSMGISRIVQEPELLLLDYSGHSPSIEIPQWNLIFKNAARSGDAKQTSNWLTGSVEDNTDQYASLFLRWVWEPAHAEFYTEWGRNDAFFNMRDFIQDPEHSRAYTYGFRKLFNYVDNSNNDNKKASPKYWQFVSEYTRLQQASSFPTRTAGYWYIHGGYRPYGYNHLGQNLGAPIGSGGNFFMMRLSQFKGMQQFGFQIESTTHNGDIYESSYAYQNPSKTKWVDMGLRIIYDQPYKHFLLSASIIAKRSYNYNWTQPSTASGFGLQNPNDLDSFLFKIGIRYL